MPCDTTGAAEKDKMRNVRYCMLFLFPINLAI